MGHFVCENNRCATFDQPRHSLRAEGVMYWQMLTGKLSR
ncbi:Mpo1-like protein [Massilia forsythiae]|nr:Mpo1-like protein [Massilia forsythiae]